MMKILYFHLVFASFLISLASSLELPPQPRANADQCSDVIPDARYDCYPDPGPTEDLCLARGCCWMPAKMDTPVCFFPSSYNIYEYLNVTETNFGLEAILGRRFKSGFPNDIENLRMTVKYETDSRLHIKIVDDANQRFETPYPEVPSVDVAASETMYIFDIDTSRQGFRILRKSDGTVLFDANGFINFIYSDQFLQISTTLPSKYIYGIGEQQSSLALPIDERSSITLFNRDVPPSFNTNLYGTHPFYVVMEDSTNSHGVFLLNSNAMDVILQPTPAITFRTIGGVLDLYFFLGPSPSDVVKQYQEVIGNPHMPPYWGLGFHLCRYGYGSLEETRNVVQRNIDAGIPLDTQWNDIDYMKTYNDFTYDEGSFGGLPEFVEDLHSKGMHYIMIVDPGISAGEEPGSYPPYEIGLEMNVFVKNSEGQPLVGKVWNPQSTVFPDFTHQNASAYWTQMLQDYHNKVAFDGIWIDMNEPSNFVDGSFDGCPASNLEDPPYVPNVLGGTLRAATVCMTAKQEAGNHYDIHNMYGFTEAIVTNKAMKAVTNKRPMIISRSSFAGHGHFAGHWSGDILSDWVDLRQSIPQLLSFSLFGIPLMGADICGFRSNTNEALCNRWQQLGAFYPFSRNHNELGTQDQDPAAMGDLVIQSTIKSLQIRYSLLPYLYTLFYKASTEGETVARPLFLEFPDDVSTYTIETQFLWGPALMIVPVLEEGAQDVNAYVPRGLWYNFYSAASLSSTGEYYNLEAPIDTIPLLVRGGYILPRQEPKLTTTETRKTNLQLLVARNENGQASGEIYWDDGESINAIEDGRYTLISFTLSDKTIRSEVVQNNSDEVLPNLGSMDVLGVQDSVSQVTANGNEAAFDYDRDRKVLTITLNGISLQGPLEITWT